MSYISRPQRGRLVIEWHSVNADALPSQRANDSEKTSAIIAEHEHPRCFLRSPCHYALRSRMHLLSDECRAGLKSRHIDNPRSPRKLAAIRGVASALQSELLCEKAANAATHSAR